jgi:lipoprotein-releasing system permease protein
MKIPRWIGFVAHRWFAARKESGGSASSVLAAAEIAIGVAALIVVLGVMNGFQLSFIDSILDISSFHVRIESESLDDALASNLAAQKGVSSVLPFTETRSLIISKDGLSFPLTLRAIPSDAGMRDPQMIKSLHFENSKKNEGPTGEGIVLGAELARYLDLQPGSQIELLVVSSGGKEGVEAKMVRVRVDGIFRSGYYDFDFGMALMSFSSSAAASIFPKDRAQRYVYGVKLYDRYSDRAFCERIQSELGLGADRVESWRDYNRAFFGALRIEKTVMMLLIGLIFLVVGVNIFHSMRRAVAERTEDIAVLKAMGAGPDELRRVFTLNGLAIGTVGALVGLILGLLIALNVNEVFSLVEAVVNGASYLWSRIAGNFSGDEFRVFSPQYFYLMEVPVRVLFPETFFVVAAAIASAEVAAASASRRIAHLAPAEVLRYE